MSKELHIYGFTTKFIYTNNDNFHVISVVDPVTFDDTELVTDTFNHQTTIKLVAKDLDFEPVIDSKKCQHFVVSSQTDSKYPSSYTLIAADQCYPKTLIDQRQLLAYLLKRQHPNLEAQHLKSLSKFGTRDQSAFDQLTEFLDTTGDHDLNKVLPNSPYTFNSNDESRLLNQLRQFRAESVYMSLFEATSLPTTTKMALIRTLDKLAPSLDDVVNNIFKVFFPKNNTDTELVKAYFEGVACDTLIAVPDDDPYFLDTLISIELTHYITQSGNSVLRHDLPDYIQFFASILENNPMLTDQQSLRGYLNQPLGESLVITNRKRVDDQSITYSSLRPLIAAEHRIEKFASASLKPAKPLVERVEEKLDQFLAERQIPLNDQQRAFVLNLNTQRLSLLTGSAGTGKSYTLSVAVAFYHSYLDIDTYCSASTTKAARVLQSYAKMPARTVHHFIAATAETTQILIVDESSMLDSQLVGSLVTRILNMETEINPETETRIILSGDVAQLLPVSPGAPFRDLLTRYPQLSTRLTRIYRQKEGALLDVLQLAENGEFQIEHAESDRWTMYNADVAYRECHTLSDVVITLKRFLEAPDLTLKDIGLISPINRVVNELNERLQAELNDNSRDPLKTICLREVNHRPYKVSINDPVVLTMIGDYRVNTGKTAACINGDTGVVVDIVGDKLFIELDYADKPDEDKVILMLDTTAKKMNGDKRNPDSVEGIYLNYASTVHKAQGFQYQRVIFVTAPVRPEMTCVNMVYTALSRAKQKVAIFGYNMWNKNYFSNMHITRETYLNLISKKESEEPSCKP